MYRIHALFLECECKYIPFTKDAYFSVNIKIFWHGWTLTTGDWEEDMAGGQLARVVLAWCIKKRYRGAKRKKQGFNLK